MFLLELWDSEDRYVSWKSLLLEQKAEENYVEDEEKISFVCLADGTKIVRVDGREIGVIKAVEVVN